MSQNTPARCSPNRAVRGPLVATALLLLLTASPAASLSLGGFTCITQNAPADCAIGEAQLSADLTGSTLTITMAGTDDAVVKKIFIEGSGVTGINFLGSVGTGVVSFQSGQPGGNLPGGAPVGFNSAVYIAASNPAPRKGIGFHSQDPVSGQAGAFMLTGDLSDLRVGVHVIGFESGGSESFITGAIPEPTGAVLFALGSLLVGVAARLRG